MDIFVEYPCDSDPCLNNGRCHQTVHNNSPYYTCSCDATHTGNRCQEYIGRPTCTVVNNYNV